MQDRVPPLNVMLFEIYSSAQGMLQTMGERTGSRTLQGPGYPPPSLEAALTNARAAIPAHPLPRLLC